MGLKLGRHLAPELKRSGDGAFRSSLDRLELGVARMSHGRMAVRPKSLGLRCVIRDGCGLFKPPYVQRLGA